MVAKISIQKQIKYVFKNIAFRGRKQLFYKKYIAQNTLMCAKLIIIFKTNWSNKPVHKFLRVIKKLHKR